MAGITETGEKCDIVFPTASGPYESTWLAAEFMDFEISLDRHLHLDVLFFRQEAV